MCNRAASEILLGGDVKARLFCRQSDPTALVRGLHTVESCSRRLGSVLRTLESLTAQDPGPDAPEVPTGGADSPERLSVVLDAVTHAIEGMDACAAALEEATKPIVTEGRFHSAGQEHYPELVSIGTPPGWETGGDRPDGTADLSRLRLLVSSVKDRYSTTVPALPWIGDERDDFCGPRLTGIRFSLERAESLLRESEDHAAGDGSPSAAGDESVVDLTDGSAGGADSAPASLVSGSN